jgi:hypothetical protein
MQETFFLAFTSRRAALLLGLSFETYGHNFH